MQRLRLATLALVVALLTSGWTWPGGDDVMVSRRDFDSWLGKEVTANLTVHRCLAFLPIVQGEQHVDLDDALVLAVMATESACYSDADDGVSVGLMSITPRPWTPTRRELHNAAINIEWGEWFIDSLLNHPEHNPDHDLRRALAAYNCGWESLDEVRLKGKNGCSSFGGYVYADQVLDYWLPRFRLHVPEDTDEAVGSGR